MQWCFNVDVVALGVAGVADGTNATLQCACPPSVSWPHLLIFCSQSDLQRRRWCSLPGPLFSSSSLRPFADSRRSAPTSPFLPRSPPPTWFVRTAPLRQRQRLRWWEARRRLLVGRLRRRRLRLVRRGGKLLLGV